MGRLWETREDGGCAAIGAIGSTEWVRTPGPIRGIVLGGCDDAAARYLQARSGKSVFVVIHGEDNVGWLRMRAIIRADSPTAFYLYAEPGSLEELIGPPDGCG